MKNRIKAVMDTLQTLEIKATYDNCTKMAGCLSELDSVFCELAEEEQKQKADAPEEHNEKPPEPEEE